MLEDDVTSSGRPIFLRALRSAVARVPLWMLCWFVPFLLALVLTLPWLTWFDSALGDRYEATPVRVLSGSVADRALPLLLKGLSFAEHRGRPVSSPSRD